MGNGPIARRVVSRLDRAVAAVARLGVYLAALALLVSMVLVGYAVVMRYVFNSAPTWVDEIVGYLLVLVVMAACADVHRRGEHVAIDVVTERLGPRGRYATVFAGAVAVALCGLFLVAQGWEMVAFSRMVGMRSNGIGLPLEWPQIAIPVGGLLLLVAALLTVFRMLVGLPPADVPTEPSRPDAARSERAQ